MEFYFRIKNDRLKPVSLPKGVTGNMNTYTCKFDIECKFTDLVWFCVFKQGTEVYNVLIVDNSCLIPYEVLTNPEPLYIGCYGKNADGETEQVSTNMTYFDLKQGAYEVAEAPDTPPEDAYTLLIKSLKAPYIGENGNWYEWDVETLSYVDSGVNARGGSDVVSDEQIQEAVNNYLEENPVEVDLSDYVQKEAGKGLSSNDFTDGDKKSIHTHDNKDVLDKITQDKINEWDSKSGGSGEKTPFSYSLTVEEDVVSIILDKNDIENIDKIGDLYMTFVVSKAISTATASDKLYIRFNNLVVGVIDTWCHLSYVMKGSLFSKCFKDFRHVQLPLTFGANGLNLYNIGTTMGLTDNQGKGSKIMDITSIKIESAKGDTLPIPKGTIITIGGYTK